MAEATADYPPSSSDYDPAGADPNRYRFLTFDLRPLTVGPMASMTFYLVSIDKTADSRLVTRHSCLSINSLGDLLGRILVTTAAVGIQTAFDLAIGSPIRKPTDFVCSE